MQKRSEQALKESLDSVTIAPELGSVIHLAVSRGQRTVRRRAIIRRVAFSLAALCLALAITVNVSPAVADAVQDIPGVGRLVKIMLLNKGPATGGHITDGQEVGPISVKDETITISFSEGVPNSTLPWFKATYRQYPYSLVLELSGVRSLSDGDVPSFTDSSLIKDMYRIVTLDDSAYRFVITFSGPVDVEVRELANPAKLQIAVSSAETKSTALVYSVRTASFGPGEQIGHMEETLREVLGWDVDTVRLLADTDGSHFAEAAYLPSREEAETLRAELLGSDLIDFALVIEERGPDSLPTYIAP